MATLAPSLRRLFQEIDSTWPHRDRRTDGWLRWPQNGISKGHNPAANGVVHAIDVDRDGLDPMAIVRNIRKPSGVLWYIIWNRTLYSNTYGWSPRAYTGDNPHTDHLHIEIYQTSAAENYSGSWNIGVQQGIGGPGGSPIPDIPPPISEGIGRADDRNYVDYMAGIIRHNQDAAVNMATLSRHFRETRDF